MILSALTQIARVSGTLYCRFGVDSGAAIIALSNSTRQHGPHSAHRAVGTGVIVVSPTAVPGACNMTRGCHAKLC